MKACITVFTERIPLTSSENLALASVFFLTIPIMIITNLLLVISLVKTKQYKTACNVFIIILSISDCFAGAVPLVFMSLLYTKYTNVHCEIELAAQFTTVFTFHVSGFMILLMTIDRYFLIKPNFEKMSELVDKIFTGSGRWYLIGVAITVALSLAVISIVLSLTADLNIFNFVILVGDSTGLFSIFIFYFKAYYRIQVYNKRKRLKDESTDTSQTTVSKRCYLYRFTKTLFLILLSYVICYLPFAFLGGSFVFLTHLKKSMPSGLRFAYYMSGVSVYTTGIANAAIIFYRNGPVRKFLSDLFYRGKLSKEEHHNEPLPATSQSSVASPVTSSVV